MFRNKARWLSKTRAALRGLLHPRSALPTPYRRHRQRIFVEPLEDRTLLSATIFGSVWDDLVADGVRAGEPGLAAVTVYLDDGSHVFNGSQQHTLTNGAGDYSFAGLAAGTYAVGLVLPTGAALTYPTGAFQPVTLGANQTAQGVDFGLQVSPDAPSDEAVTNDAGVQQMPSIAVDPHDSKHVVMAFLDYNRQAEGIANNGFAGVRVQVSHDGGATWQQTVVPLNGNFSQAAGQPVVQFDKDGGVNVVFQSATFLGKDSNGSSLTPGIIQDTTTQTVNYLGKNVTRRTFGMVANNGIFIAHSNDGGLTWGSPVAVTAQRYDLTKTTSNTAVTTPGSTVQITPAAMPANLFVNEALIIDEGLPSMERVTVTAFDATTFTAKFNKAHSAGFTISVPVAFDVSPDFVVDNNPSSPTYGTMYVTFARFYPASQFPGRTTSTSGSEVMLAVSHDGGQTWTTLRQTVGGAKFSVIKDPLTGTAGATTTEGTGSNAFPRVTVGPEGGVYVSEFAGGRFPVFYSTNGGVSFRNPVPDTTNTYSAGYPFGLDSDAYTSIYPSGASTASFTPRATLFNNSFRTFSVRAIAADPTRAGRIYAVEAVQVLTTAGTVLDAGEITFSYSTDYGVTWHNQFTVGANVGNLSELPANLQFRYRGVLNDDNATRFVGFDSTLQDEVISGQALPQLSVDAQGNIAVIWYDTRRNVANKLLDVYGTVSTDGGLTFSANKRISSTNFDAASGAFTDGRGANDFYLGDRIGLAMAGGTVYAAWTGTTGQAGNQDVYFSSYDLASVPFNDRFENNNTPPTFTDLGKVTVQQVVPRLSLPQGDEDWFRAEAGATGQLVVVASAAVSDGLQLELWDSTDTTRLAVGTAVVVNGRVVGQQVQYAAVSGQKYLVHVSGSAAEYSLGLQSLTADLGTTVETGADGTVSAGGTALYRLVPAVGGSLNVSLAAGSAVQGNLSFQVLSADGRTVLAAGSNLAKGESGTISVPVSSSTPVLLQVSSVSTASVLVNGAPVTLALGTPGPAILFGTPSNLKSILQVAGNKALNVRVTILNSAGTAIGTQDYTLQPGVPVTLNLPANGGFNLQALDPAGSGSFHLGATNLDPYETTGNTAVSFPTGGSSSSVTTADVNQDGKPDLILTSTQGGDVVRVMLSNGDGTFQAAREFAVGSGQAAVSAREPVVADVTGDGIPDIIVPNYFSADVSVLVGVGDGNFLPQRQFDALYKANSVTAGDFNGDGKIDLAVLDRTAFSATVAVLMGRGDGTFLPPQDVPLPAFALGDAFPIRAGDVNGDGKTDLVAFGPDNAIGQVLLGNGDGTFTVGASFSTGEVVFAAQLADLNGDSKLDVVVGGGTTGSVLFLAGNGDGTFQPLQAYSTATFRPGDSVGAISLGVTDYTGDGRPDVLVTTRTRSGTDAPQVFVLPGIAPDGSGHVFGPAQRLATLTEAGRLAVADFDGDGHKDLVVTETGGVRAIYGNPLTFTPNTTLATARELGTVVHFLGQPQAIVTGFTDAWYRLTVPTEAANGAGNQIVDFSALFQSVQGAGLQMEVRDSTGTQILGTGSRFRVEVAQGAQLLVHVFALPAAGGVARGAGTYTLDIDVLPQLVSVEAQSFLPGSNGAPGGAVNTLVLTFQGDRLDPATAENPANYRITWLGEDGQTGSAGGQVIPLGVVGGGQSVVYAPGVNRDVSTGRTFPTAVRQTVTLYFANPLPAGYYRIEVANVQAAPFSATELPMLAPRSGFNGHSLVSKPAGQIVEGSDRVYDKLVKAAGPVNLGTIGQGSTFLTQMHGNLGAMLSAMQNVVGDGPGITSAVNQQIVSSALPGAGALSFLILWFDPVSFDVADPSGNRAVVDLRTNQVTNAQARTFIEAGGNVEVMVIAGVAGTYTVNLSDAQSTARAGAVLIEGGEARSVAMTTDLRGGQTSFSFEFAQQAQQALQTVQTTAAFFPSPVPVVQLPVSADLETASRQIQVANNNGSVLDVFASLTNEGAFEALVASLIINPSPQGLQSAVNENAELGGGALAGMLAELVESVQGWSLAGGNLLDEAGGRLAGLARVSVQPLGESVARGWEALVGKGASFPDPGLKAIAQDVAEALKEVGKSAIDAIMGTIDAFRTGKTKPPMSPPAEQAEPEPRQTPPGNPPEESLPQAQAQPARELDQPTRSEPSSGDTPIDQPSDDLSILCVSAVFATGLWLGCPRPAVRRNEVNRWLGLERNKFWWEER